MEERLAIYEEVRRNRAASIQILSNVGFDEAAPPELSEFLEGESIPSRSSAGEKGGCNSQLIVFALVGNTHEMIRLAYVPDVVEKTAHHIRRFDPSFQVPEGFFQPLTQGPGAEKL